MSKFILLVKELVAKGRIKGFLYNKVAMGLLAEVLITTPIAGITTYKMVTASEQRKVELGLIYKLKTHYKKRKQKN